MASLLLSSVMGRGNGKILDPVVATTGMGRSTARQMLTGPRLPGPAEQVDGRSLRPRGFSDEARALLEHVWALMGMPCGKYLVVMHDLWLPLLTAAGDLDKPLVTEASVAELKATALPGANRMPHWAAGTLPDGFPARAVRTRT
ncbi:Conserved protein of uncharacterised function%2C possible transposase remnant [Mycobacterium tuberculosis]|nr:conserved hypothetical protein [Mycobacterium tuberculosis F11]ACT24216.1 conserved hypothetical protein [Mycobacterium tuberculosis KZN 1435]AEB03306.1 conserved hypothetical protein [Mycobacterium tuberculosis KZN 4207]AFM48553.1 hypothetical protein TBXG_001157 [Mycobacterium tuberculosis KZN 605]AMC43031.1 hypothetical protein RN03_3073 [Mycobacterium tuberculosis]AQN83611.1 hypothetical protein L766_15005 [Mycobacterium tuberculosis TRS9]AQN87505.1 hypothetical protein L787_14960 [Myc